MLSYLVTIDLRRAVLTREFQVRDQRGRTTTVKQRRFVAMHMPHVGAIETTVRAENWSGTLEFRCVVDGDVQNQLVGRYHDLSSRHLAVRQMQELSSDSMLLAAETVQSRTRIAVAARSTVWRDDVALSADYRLVKEDSRIGHDIAVDMAVGQSVTLEKVATIFTGRDHGISEPAVDAERELNRLGRYADLEHGHRLAWAHLWERFNIEMGGDADALRIIRIHQLHLLQTLSPHTADLDVGVPARGLHGEAYRGHIFWDELFVFPVLNLRLPEVDPLAASVPLPAIAGGAPRGKGSRLRRGHVSLAVGQRRPRREPANAPQPAVGPVESRIPAHARTTSASPSPTTCGSTTRSPATSGF